MKNIKGLLLLLLLCPVSLWASVVKGRVLDEKGNGLGFASVFVQGTQTGVMADAKGNFELSLVPGKYTLICRFTAYQTEEKTMQLTAGASKEIVFHLKPEKLMLDEVVIHANAEDPAYAIMRKVIEKRKYHENLVKTRETDIYLKGSLHVVKLPEAFKVSLNEDTLSNFGLDSTGSGIIYLLEEKSHYTYQNPNKEFNKVISVRQSGDPHGLGFASMPPILNIYQNNINVLGLNNRGFISPANNGAFHYYRFKYLGSFQQYGRTIDKIKVTPKRKYEPLFSGTVYVAEGDWVFQNVDLYLTKSAQLSGIDTLHLTQTFSPVQKDIWAIQNQVLGLKLRIFGIHLKGVFLTVYQNQKINQPVDETLFSGKTIAAYDSLATKKDSSYWAANRPVPMTKAEKKNFHSRDSAYLAKIKKKDSIKTHPQVKLGLFSLLLGNPHIRYKNNEWAMRPLLRAIQYNTVEGLSATLDLQWKHTFSSDSSVSFKLSWLNRYGFHNRHFNSLVHFGMRYADEKWRQRYFSWELTFGQYLYQINGQNPIMPVMNEIYTLLAGRNYLKLYENRLVKLALDRDFGNGFHTDLSLRYEKRQALHNTTDYSLRKRHDAGITTNLPAGKTMPKNQNAAVVALTLTYQPGVHYIQYPDYKLPLFGNAPIFSFNYTQGIKALNATADFAKWRLAMKHGFRMHMMGHLNYKLATGGFLWHHQTNLPDWQHINGNRTFLANPFLNSFQLAPYYRYSNLADLYGEAHLEWHLDGLFTNKIPLFRRLNWYLVTGTNVLYINKNSYYAEVFAGLENIGIGLLRFGRVDFIAGYVSGSDKPSVGLRLSFSGLLNELFNTQTAKDL